MALLAEQLVDEWLNRKGFFTLRGIKRGVHEIDLLGVRMQKGRLEGWHVEVQISFRPISYIGKLSESQREEMGVKHPNSAKKRSPNILKSTIDDWVGKKFKSPKKIEMRNDCWKNIDWQLKFVHANVTDSKELQLIGACGVELISFGNVLEELCGHKPGELFGGAGTDIAEMIRYYATFSKNDDAVGRR